MATRERNELTRRPAPPAVHTPFDMMRRLLDPFDRLPFGDPFRLMSDPAGTSGWAPQVETEQRGDQFVVRADLPGLEKKDVNVELKDDVLVIEGERNNQSEHRADGYVRTERSYGRFCRTVPLPVGAIGDSVKASFRNGVLEVVMSAPPQEANRGRRIDIA